MSEEAEEKIVGKSFKSHNSELDRKIGHIRFPAIFLIEGPNNSGKSVIAQQYIYGALQSGYKAYYITTESSSKQLIDNMENLSFDVRYQFLNGNLKIIEFHVKELNWHKEVAGTFLNLLVRTIKNNVSNFDIFAIDSLTYIATYASEEDLLSFFTNMRNIVDEYDKVLMVTVHPHAFNQEMMLRIRSICDVHFILSIKEVGDKIVRLLQVPKIKGAVKSVSIVLSFEVDPAFGIKVLPISQARA